MSTAFACPNCGEREFRMVVYKKTSSSYSKARNSSLFECSVCGYKERI